MRFVYKCAGLDQEMGFSIGVDPAAIDSANLIASKANDAYGAASFGTAASMGTGWSYLGTRATLMISGLPEIGQSVENVAGTASLDTIPPNCSVLVRKNTNAGGRRNRGRLYIPPYGIQGSDVDRAGVLEQTVVDGLNAQMAGFIGSLITEGLDPVLFHSEPDSVPASITSLGVQSRLATQRRRMR